MRINFRQGLVSSKVSTLGQPDFLTTNPQGVMLNGAELPLVASIADGPKNYTISINSSFVAWPTLLFSGVSEAWMYVDINRATSALTYGITQVAPAYGPVAPSTPTDGALWFNTTRLENMMFNASANRWFPVLRVTLGHYTTTSIDEVAFGSQVGITGATVTSGQIVSDGFGRALTDSSGRFFTTEDVVLISGVESHAAKLESNVIMGSAAEPIPAFHVVRFNSAGAIELADYDDVGDAVIGMAVVSGVQGNPINIVLSGLVYNPAWTFSGPNATLWVNQTGQLVTVDPFDQGNRSKRRVPIGRTIDRHTIIFDQGMGGVGEKGDAGAVEGIPVASGTVVGITRMSVDPEDPMVPIAVGDNDPRLTDPRVPLEHTHPATNITVSPFGTFNGTNAQQALEHIQTVKLNLSGGTVTGPISSTVQATQDAHLVTLGQAKSEITARAVTERRYTLSDNYVTVVQAFNALSPAQRTLAVNTVVVAEWRGDMYLWAGGYGAPVSATDSAQFLLIGRLITDTPPLTFKTIEAIVTYAAAAAPSAIQLIALITGGEISSVVKINSEDGSTVIMEDAAPSSLTMYRVVYSAAANELAWVYRDEDAIIFYDAETMVERDRLPLTQGVSRTMTYNTTGTLGAYAKESPDDAGLSPTSVVVFDSLTKEEVLVIPGYQLSEGSAGNRGEEVSFCINAAGTVLMHTKGYSLNDGNIPLQRVLIPSGVTTTLSNTRFTWVGVCADDVAITASIKDEANTVEFHMFDMNQDLPQNLPNTPNAVASTASELLSLTACYWNGVHYAMYTRYDVNTDTDVAICINMETGTHVQVATPNSTYHPWRIKTDRTNTLVTLGVWIDTTPYAEELWSIDPSTGTVISTISRINGTEYYDEFVPL